MASTSGWPHNFSAFSFGPPPSPFEPPSFTYRLLSSPLRFFAQHLYALILLLRGSSYASPTPFARIRLVCISDTHTHKATPVPPGDVLIHSGDLTNDGTVAELQDQVDWLSSLPHRYKIAIAGNHDCYLDPKSRRREDNGRTVDWKDIHYLQHANLTLSFSAHRNRRLTFYGAPQIPQCGGDDFAFQYPNRKDIWSNTIPKGTDVLITHTPPRHHLDLPQGMGCEHLLNEIWTVKPKVHVFGHVHAGYGKLYLRSMSTPVAFLLVFKDFPLLEL